MPNVKQLLFLAFLLAAAGCAPPTASDDFPTKPIKLIVYTKPGGSIDITARKFTEVAAEYTTATFVVENKAGAGGIVAMKDVLAAKADGYSLFACTKSNIAKIAATGDPALVDSFHWLAMLMADPECIITRADVKPSTWQELLSDARQQQGRQIWVGPAFGGLDHIMALKTWEKAGISATWVPYQSGGKAKAELLGERGVAYVGNPSEVRTNPDQLQVAAVASPARLPQFPAAPTLRELGLEGLEGEVMWRGLAVKQGVPDEVLQWYGDLIQKVSADPRWRAFWEKDGIHVQYQDSAAFTATVERDLQDFTHYLGQLGVVRSGVSTPLARFFAGWSPLAVLGVLGILSGFAAKKRYAPGTDVGEVVIPLALLSLGLMLLAASLLFPRADEVGAAAIPQLWIWFLLPICVVLLWQAFRSVAANGDRDKYPTAAMAAGSLIRTPVAPFILLMIIYVPCVWLLGYFPSTFLFLVVAMFLLGERRVARVLGIATAWLVFSYVVFARLLFVPLPVGSLVERFL